MIEDDSDLKRMFAAQREIDEQHAPVFDAVWLSKHVNAACSGTAQAVGVMLTHRKSFAFR